MSRQERNRNLERKLLPGLVMLALAPALRLGTLPLRRKASTESPLLIFSSYMIGDLFMALPAIRRLAGGTAIRVICRPDCVDTLRREGFDPIPFDNAFFTRWTASAFLRTLRAAWALRQVPMSDALDLDADPRTAFWLRIAGCRHVRSYRRPFGVLFDGTLELPSGAVHQADRDMEVVEGFLRGRRTTDDGRRETFSLAPRQPGADSSSTARRPISAIPFSAVRYPPSDIPEERPAKNRSWLLSLWTRKPGKNWPFERWEKLIELLEKAGVPFAVLHAPDGDASHERFLGRLRGRAEIVEGSLEEVAERVKGSAGVIATDNFLGHMAGYYGKPVLWINVSSPAEQVVPRGPRTVVVGNGSPEAPRLPDVEEVWRGFETLRGEGRPVSGTSAIRP